MQKENPARRSAPPTLPTDKDHHRAGPELRASTRPRPISLPRLRPAVGDHPVARPAASAAGGIVQKENAARRSAPPTLPTDKDHHRAGPELRASTRPRPISLPRLCGPAVGDHPVARPAASAAGELCKKKIRRGARRRQRCQRIKTTTVPARESRASRPPRPISSPRRRARLLLLQSQPKMVRRDERRRVPIADMANRQGNTPEVGEPTTSTSLGCAARHRPVRVLPVVLVVRAASGTCRRSAN